ncbi:MAG TPA: hypothetical protein DER05_12340 [Lutibacter sp.]|nr:hypothetical protein [Lutibacter sp.]
MIKTSKKILLTFTVIIGLLLSYGIFYTDVNLSFNTEITADENDSSEDLISTSDASADDQINTCHEISNYDIKLIQKNIFTSFFVLSRLSFSIWQPPKLS